MFLHGIKSENPGSPPYLPENLLDKSHKFLSMQIRSVIRQKRRKLRPKAKTLPCASLPGSITVEAAFALPIALFVLLTMLGFFTVLQVEAEMTEALQYASRTLAVKCGVAETTAGILRNEDKENNKTKKNLTSYAGGAATVTAGKKLTLKYLKKNGCWTEWIHNYDRLGSGISFARSQADGDYVKLRVSYQVKLPINCFGVSVLPVRQGVCARKWTGNVITEEDGEEGYVYVTRNGTVYHKSLQCRYLNIRIHAVSKSGVAKMRNKNGGKYYPCTCTRRSSAVGGVVYITDYGNKYHSRSSCGRIYRSVRKIKESEAEGYRACSGCAK